MEKSEILKNFFGFTSFRGGQEKLIDSIMEGRDVLGIMPTGGGKSLCYQIPALMFPGITLVISPLISLMKDQVMSLKAAGISAAYINSTLSYDQKQQVFFNIKNGEYKIIYVAPERLELDGFLELAKMLPIAVIAVDEAHCISEWGNDFRPSYLKIADFVECLSDRPIIAAFTATATARVGQDIKEKLRLFNPVEVITGFDRPNLRFEVQHPAKKMPQLLNIMQKYPNKSGIIYCMTRKNVESVCEFLQKNGINATRYHAGLSDKERKVNQEDFVYDRKPVMVATNAFGMGIDKSNVSFVIHYNMPMSIEAYYQEAGRAGRDGAVADCILLYSARDIATAKLLIENSETDIEVDKKQREEQKRIDHIRLNRMIKYCKTTKCLRANILEYFGQSHNEKCDNCGNCNTTFAEKDITVESQKILSCIRRIYDKLGYHVGANMIVMVLRGSREKRVLDLGLQDISTYNLMATYSENEIREIINYLIDSEYIIQDSKYFTLRFTEKAQNVLYYGQHILMPFKQEMPKTAKNKRKTKAECLNDPLLYDRLRQLRFELATKQNVPAFVIFSNATLFDMAAKKPRTIEEFLLVSGVGNVKSEQYGNLFVEEINDYLDGFRKV